MAGDEPRAAGGHTRGMSDSPIIASIETKDAAGTAVAADYAELARLKLAAGDAPGAVRAYEQCLERAPASPGLLNNFGAALLRAGRIAEATVRLEAALALEPDYPRARVNLAKALREAGLAAEAIAHLRRVLAANPLYAPALINLGDALAAAGDLAAAQHALETAVRIEPTNVDARMTLGMVRLQRGDADAAVEELKAGVALAPDHADAHANLGHALFSSGDWAAAWPHFEHRFRRNAHWKKPAPPAALSRWDGVISPDLELWLIGEQGLGDQLQFIRYSKLMREAGVRCVAACDSPLVELISRAGLASRVVPLADLEASAAATLGLTQTVTAPHAPPEARWIPLLSLPAWHRTQPDTVPFADGYLAADSASVARWEARIPSASLRVAVAWAGNPRMETGSYRGRSPPLSALAPLLEVPDVQIISLQKGATSRQLAQALGGEVLCFEDLDAGPAAFLDSSAILKCVDLLVTSDTAIAHLAGALGVRTWLCLMREPDWRWMREGAATPWYSSMRLFRQDAGRNWHSVFRGVAEELHRLARLHGSAQQAGSRRRPGPLTRPP